MDGKQKKEEEIREWNGTQEWNLSIFHNLKKNQNNNKDREGRQGMQVQAISIQKRRSIIF